MSDYGMFNSDVQQLEIALKDQSMREYKKSMSEILPSSEPTITEFKLGYEAGARAMKESLEKRIEYLERFVANEINCRQGGSGYAGNAPQHNAQGGMGISAIFNK